MGWGAFLSIIDRILAFLTSALKKHEQNEAQKERDDVQKDPAGWFNGHFGGGVQLPDAPDQSSAETDKAPPDSKIH
jgi:hypothetical protein